MSRIEKIRLDKSEEEELLRSEVVANESRYRQTEGLGGGVCRHHCHQGLTLDMCLNSLLVTQDKSWLY